MSLGVEYIPDLSESGRIQKTSKNFAMRLDNGVGVAYDDDMNNDLITAAARLAKANAKNKRTIQAKRARFAQTKANLENIPHPGKFPSKYKYG